MKIKEGFTLRQICGEYVVVGEGLACSILDAFFAAEFEGGRHANRVEMLEHIEP